MIVELCVPALAFLVTVLIMLCQAEGSWLLIVFWSVVRSAQLPQPPELVLVPFI